MITGNNYQLQVKTVHLPGLPTRESSDCLHELPAERATIARHLLEYESFLRRNAYRNTTIAVNAAFFNDTDLAAPFCISVVYDENTQTPLLSVRYYNDIASIRRYLNGDVSQEHLNTFLSSVYNPRLFEKPLFLADRLSGNTASRLYRQLRASVFKLLYAELRQQSQMEPLVIMVRDTASNQQLKRYMVLGFRVLGHCVHKTKKHWIVLVDQTT